MCPHGNAAGTPQYHQHSNYHADVNEVHTHGRLKFLVTYWHSNFNVSTELQSVICVMQV